MHEQSETIQLPGGKWVNVYGRGVRGKAGLPLPIEHQFEKPYYDTVEEAEAAARKRSEMSAPEAAQGAGMLSDIFAGPR